MNILYQIAALITIFVTPVIISLSSLLLLYIGFYGFFINRHIFIYSQRAYGLLFLASGSSLVYGSFLIWVNLFDMLESS